MITGGGLLESSALPPASAMQFIYVGDRVRARMTFNHLDPPTTTFGGHGVPSQDIEEGSVGIVREILANGDFRIDWVDRDDEEELWEELWNESRSPDGVITIDAQAELDVYEFGQWSSDPSPWDPHKIPADTSLLIYSLTVWLLVWLSAQYDRAMMLWCGMTWRASEDRFSAAQLSWVIGIVVVSIFIAVCPVFGRTSLQEWRRHEEHGPGWLDWLHFFGAAGKARWKTLLLVVTAIGLWIATRELVTPVVIVFTASLAWSDSILDDAMFVCVEGYIKATPTRTAKLGISLAMTFGFAATVCLAILAGDWNKFQSVVARFGIFKVLHAFLEERYQWTFTPTWHGPSTFKFDALGNEAGVQTRKLFVRFSNAVNNMDNAALESFFRAADDLFGETRASVWRARNSHPENRTSEWAPTVEQWRQIQIAKTKDRKIEREAEMTAAVAKAEYDKRPSCWEAIQQYLEKRARRAAKKKVKDAAKAAADEERRAEAAQRRAAASAKADERRADAAKKKKATLERKQLKRRAAVAAAQQQEQQDSANAAAAAASSARKTAKSNSKLRAKQRKAARKLVGAADAAFAAARGAVNGAAAACEVAAAAPDVARAEAQRRVREKRSLLARAAAEAEAAAAAAVEAAAAAAADAAPPSDYVCPITCELMRDPVLTVDGETYERTAIEEWFGRGNSTAPRTGAKLDSTVIFPNKLVKRAITTWRAEHPDS